MEREDIKIGKFVQQYIKKIFDYCEQNPDEFERLQDIDYSKYTFGINYPFCNQAAKISEDELRERYWKKKYNICNQHIKVTNDWYERNTDHFCSYLISKKLTTKQELRKLTPLHRQPNKQKPMSTNRQNSRYKGAAIGNAQNLTIRNILSNLGTESFAKNNWEETKKYFENKCAYCGCEEKLEIEHAIPINKKELGEHRLGNIIPSCKDCNSKKHKQHYIEFLGSDTKRVNIIKEYMKVRHYTPITDNAKINRILDMAYNDVRQISDRYIKIINDLLQEDKSL